MWSLHANRLVKLEVRKVQTAYDDYALTTSPGVGSGLDCMAQSANQSAERGCVYHSDGTYSSWRFTTFRRMHIRRSLTRVACVIRMFSIRFACWRPWKGQLTDGHVGRQVVGLPSRRYWRRSRFGGLRLKLNHEEGQWSAHVPVLRRRSVRTLGAGGFGLGAAALGKPMPGPGPTPLPVGKGKTAIKSPCDCLPFISRSSANSLDVLTMSVHGTEKLAKALTSREPS